MKLKHTKGPWKYEEPTKTIRTQKENYWLATVDSWNGAVKDEQPNNGKLMAAAPDLLKSLCNLLEWAKGNKGSKHINPYGVPEVKSALETLAKLQGIKDYLDAKTK